MGRGSGGLCLRDGNTGIEFSVGLFRAVGGREGGLVGVSKVKSLARQLRLLSFILLRSLSDTLLVVSILEIITVYNNGWNNEELFCFCFFSFQPAVT